MMAAIHTQEVREGERQAAIPHVSDPDPGRMHVTAWEHTAHVDEREQLAVIYTSAWLAPKAYEVALKDSLHADGPP